MSDLEDFDHVFGICGEEEFDRVYQRIQLEEQENRRNIAHRRRVCIRISQCSKYLIRNSQFIVLQTSYNDTFSCNIRNGFNLKKWYHSKTGVYGYRPHKKHAFQDARDSLQSRINQSNFYRLVTAYREHGHKKANINPISIAPESEIPELKLSYYGLNETDRVTFSGILSTPMADGTVGDAVDFLQQTYSTHMSAEFNHLEELEEREWFAEKMEQESQITLDADIRKDIAREMLKSQAFDNFLAAKFVTVKRYGGEGAESMMAFFIQFFKSVVSGGVEQLVMCMPHRGRFNLLTGMLGFPPAQLFRKLKGISEFPEHAKATGDVPSHFTSSVDVKINSKTLHVTMIPGPSHLEQSKPYNSIMSLGKTRARQLSIQEGGYSKDNSSNWSDKVLNLQIHGDAAFTGQGVNQESLQLSRAPHFEVGGAVHLVVNNQLGFTTPADRGRSSRYSTDLAKIIASPVIHVNGDFPEIVVKATKIACEYQRKFRKDIFIDLNCYRQWGHNELDDPTFTNPAVYSIIQAKRTVPDLYADILVEEGILAKEEVNDILVEHSTWLNNILKTIDNYTPQETFLQKQWSAVQQADSAVTIWDTGVDNDLLRYVGYKSVSYPQDFNIHPHLLKTHVTARLNKLKDGNNIDWATAETLAFGSLLYQGYNVRISGQDVGRGTFSHRHVMLVDQKTNEMYIPLNYLMDDQTGHLEVANSILSEEAVLAFEYGMSVENPNNLIIWEAQFGDFFNGAQIPIDTYVTGGETKWMMCSGLVMLLPHGYDGAGPEHSSCRLERFLQLSDSNESKPDGDDVNIHITNPTTPAQYFHLIRKQNFRKPLIMVAPKTLLRLPEATSKLQDMAPQTAFAPVLGDKLKEPDKVQRVIFVTGKHYYALDKQRKLNNAKDVAIIRLEGLSPFPTLNIQQEVAKYKNAKLFIWSQEEHQNMGAWTFMKPRFENLIGRKLKYVGRGPLATPAVGIGQIHQKQSEYVITKPFTIR
ncbi:hypothetical protein L9F63_000289 [Diploptera punctata]|uniref:Transketolase-like pyrimidine-binding domain-containing protein n=1 Tax=Diploptera punctata TaxID=6984 RepID=A0AAD8AMV5_DIPPU|nr:hypothetical protein L9F63_000289 [Diploptera punctata]